ncbi:restriction endonuclease subunit S [Bacteroides fragilis]|uniref:restriction endonuclease subunit S n=1 Tax=Bacteroides fragilis TaxID=817 RepID=UPI0034A5B867
MGNVPHLRFPEFTEEWKETKLGKIAEITKGSGISKDRLSEYGSPCILYGELYTKYKSEIINEVYSRTELDSSLLVKSKANDVIIPCSGETAIDISTARCVPFNNILLGGDLNIIRLKNNDGGFFAYQLNGTRKKDIARVAQGVSVVHLYGENLKHIRVYHPAIEEQKKITRLLSLIDKRIATQNKIIEDLKKLKSAISERLFNAIKGDVVVLEDIGDVVKGKQINGEFLSESGKYYVMNGGIEPSGFYNDYNVEANTISISEGGNSCGYVQFNACPFWSGGHCYTIQNTTDNVKTEYLYQFLKSKESEIMKLRIGSGLPNIQKKDLAKFKITIPNISEQKVISAFLSSFERKADVEMNFVNLLLEEKQYLLRQMFI